MRRNAIAAALLGVALASGGHASCYSVYDRSQALVYQNTESPVDLARPIGDTVPERFGQGAAMVMTLDGRDCLPRGVADTGKPFEGAGWEHLETGSVAAYGTAYAGGAGGGMGASFGSSAPLGYPHTGPRGGQYRLTASGNKVYRPRSK